MMGAVVGRQTLSNIMIQLIELSRSGGVFPSIKGLFTDHRFLPLFKPCADD